MGAERTEGKETQSGVVGGRTAKERKRGRWGLRPGAGGGMVLVFLQEVFCSRLILPVPQGWVPEGPALSPGKQTSGAASVLGLAQTSKLQDQTELASPSRPVPQGQAEQSLLPDFQS